MKSKKRKRTTKPSRECMNCGREVRKSKPTEVDFNDEDLVICDECDDADPFLHHED